MLEQYGLTAPQIAMKISQNLWRSNHMTNLEKYINAFLETFEIKASETKGLEYQAIPEWDSIGHMALVTALEGTFGIMMDTDDIINLNSFEKGKEIMSKYDVEF